MFFWEWDQTLRFGLITLGIFALIGGVVSQTSAGASGKGFIEGLWKGFEVWVICAVILGVIYLAMMVMGITTTAINTA